MNLGEKIYKAKFQSSIMAADMTEKVKELQKSPTYIRNIAICAHIDHGKNYVL